MSGIARAGTGEALAEGTGAEAYMVDVDVDASFSSSAADDCDDRVQYAGGFVSFVSGFLSVSSKKVGIGLGNGSRNCSPAVHQSVENRILHQYVVRLRVQ